MTLDQEIEALKYVRNTLTSWYYTPYICINLQLYFGMSRDQFSKTQLHKEIHEFLDGESTVDTWLGIDARPIPNIFRIAIIDTLLARRGVF